MQTRRRRVFSLLAMAAALLGALAIPCAAAEGEKEKAEKAEAPASDDPSIEDLVAKAKESVVTVTHSGRGGKEEGLGTGFVIAPRGLIATNLHVIGEARPIEIEFADGRTLPVEEIHAWDRKLDLAIVRVAAENLKPLALGDSDTLKQGAEIIALGNPQGLKFSVVKGIVSAIRSFEEEEATALIQVAIPVEPGNSGGPLLDRGGEVRGIVTFKSAVSENLGFAMPSNAIKLLLDKPNPVPMKRWLTIGALDSSKWSPLMGSRWSQWAGVIYAAGYGAGFGGRSLCLYQPETPEIPYEIAVDVRLDDESGAAGLVFASDGSQIHYGFYPSGGNLRLTRFQGSDPFSWKVLHEVPAENYRRGDWNEIRVRVEKDRIVCFVNGESLLESGDRVLREGRVGLCKFRGTEAEFRAFRLGSDLSAPPVPTALVNRLSKRIAAYSDSKTNAGDILETLLKHPATSREILIDQAKALEKNARRLEMLAEKVHRNDIARQLRETLEKNESEIDLFHAGLLVAKLDNPQLDVAAYREELDRMAGEIKASIEGNADARARIESLNKYLFEENGFHGSRSAYYTRSNSYLNEVLDDHEGIPITLAIVYMELAGRVGIDGVAGIPLPGHFIVEHRPAEGEGCYIDVFDGGKFLERSEAEEIVLGFTGQEPRPEHFEPAKKKDIILRMLSNLIGIDLNSDAPGGAIPYLDVYLALDPDSAGQRLSRALLLFQTEDYEGARADLRWLLDREPEGVNIDRLRQLYERLE